MPTKPKIIYVDDEEINIFLFKNYFKDKYDVITACDGAEGLKALEKNTSALFVISDFKMPHMDGIDFIEKAHEKYPDKKYFILTGYDMTDKILEAMETGLVTEKFTKPLKYEIIEEVMEKMLI